MKKSMVLKMVGEQPSGKRYEVDEEAGEVRVCDEKKVQLKEVLPHLIKPKRAFNNFCEGAQSQISWKAI